jgi:hypothetical protein
MAPDRRTPRRDLVRTPRFRSPVARAVVPVFGGILFFAALFGITYLIAVLVSDDTEGIRIGDKQFTIGRADIAAERIRRYGPLLYADLKGTEGEQAIVVDHNENSPDTEGWSVYFAYRSDRGPSCLVSVNQETQRLQDCDGAPVSVDELEPAAPDAEVVVELGNKPVVKVRFAAALPPTTVTATTG